MVAAAELVVPPQMPLRQATPSRLLTAFPSDVGNVLALADHFFPGCGIRCQLFASKRTDGWFTQVDDENWIEKPSVR